jgi:phage recombination protein Bet
MTTALATMTNKLAQRLDMGVDGSSLIDTLKATAFKGQVTDAQMVALLVVANQYALNPWTKELYAFPDKNNGIIPVVGVDGWSRIINSNENFDGMDFVQDEESCTCIIHRKDRSHPIKVTEYLSECRRDVAPWKSHPRRMLRHKAMIQCARIAFGYVGIYDPDEAERIQEGERQPQQKQAEAVVLINDAQAKQIRDALAVAGRSEDAFCTKARIAAIEELEACRFDAALNLITAAAAPQDRAA